MKIRSDKGVTEIHFKDLVAVEPKCEQVRAAFREKRADKDKVEAWVSKTFGQNRYSRDFDRITEGVDSPVKRLRKWDEWIAAQPIVTRKLYYDPSIVSACIMGDDV